MGIAAVTGAPMSLGLRSARAFETEAPADLLFSDSGEQVQFIAKDFRRSTVDVATCLARTSDFHARYDARIGYLRALPAENREPLTLCSNALVTRHLSGADFGSLLSITYEGTDYTLWLPGFQQQLRLESGGRIAAAAGSSLSCAWAFVPRVELTIRGSGNLGEMAVIPYMIVKDPGRVFIAELSSPSDPERRLYRKSNWFFGAGPKDIWKYLINGSVYDPRSIKGIDKRFKCQQCAFAWWNYLNFLHQDTGKRVYELLREEIAYTVLLDLSAEGEWGHGFWSDDIETHSRFHLDGIHLLICQYEKTSSPIWLEAAERAMAFVFNHLVDRFDDGSPWFLHDTLENKIQKHRFRSTLFGKSPGNSLCINTHVQALTVLHRLWQGTPDPTVYRDNFERGMAALRRVLDHQPATFLYRIFAKALTSYYRHAAPTGDRYKRIRNAAKWQGIDMAYRWLKQFFPRLTLPGGFIDRDLTLSVASDHYHTLNLKDLLTLYRQRPEPWLRDYIKDGFKFIFGIVRGWGLDKAVLRSPYYFEFIDVLHLYDRLIEPLPAQEISRIKETLKGSTGGCSLDYYASEFVRS